MANQYNPYSYAAVEATGVTALLATTVANAFEAGVQALNTVITAGAAYYQVADVYESFQTAEENPCNASFSPMNLDFHPNAYGHELIAAAIADKLPEPDPEVEPNIYVAAWDSTGMRIPQPTPKRMKMDRSPPRAQPRAITTFPGMVRP